MRPTALCQLRSGTEKTSDIPYGLAGGESLVATEDNHKTTRIKGNTAQHYTMKYSQPIGMLHRTPYPVPRRTTHYNTTQDNHNTIKGNTTQHYTMKYSQPMGMSHRTTYPAPHRTTHYNTTQDNHNTTEGNTTQHYTMKSFDPPFNSPFEQQEYFLGERRPVSRADNRTVM